jgi:hypothetical protein
MPRARRAQRLPGGRKSTAVADSSPPVALRRLSPSEAAWIALAPAAAIVVTAIAVLGPLIAAGLLRPAPLHFWAVVRGQIHTEPDEQGRYLVALSGPLVVAALTVACARLRLRASPTRIDVAVVVAQSVLVGFLALCFLQQRSELLGPLYPVGRGPDMRLTFFTPRTLVAAAAITASLAVMLGAPGLRARLSRATSETRTRRALVVVVALAAVTVWLLPGANTEGTIGLANPQVAYHVQFPLDETFAVLDGRTPLVNYVSQYGSLWPYLEAVAMSLAGKSVGVWVTIALVASGLGMLSIFAVLRRVAGSSVRGLLLFLPLIATSFFLVSGPLDNRYTYGNYFGTFPIRYAGPAVLAWLAARHLARARPHTTVLLFFAAGLVALNNADAGIPALGATIAALAWGAETRTRPALLRLAVLAAAGLAASLAVVSALTLTRAGALPDPSVALRFSRLFSTAGFGLFPMPTIGFHLVVYVTFVAAVGAATVEALRRDGDRVLAGMLAWSGVFGLGAGAYFAGRSSPENLVASFFPWSFALALLVVVALRGGLGVRWWRDRPPIAALACLFGFAAMACSLAQTPTPWGQLDRLRHTGPATIHSPPWQPFVAHYVRRGEPVLLFLPLGHRVAATLDVDDVAPYADPLSMPTTEQWHEAIGDLRAAHGRKLFLSVRYTTEEMRVLLSKAGFSAVAEDGAGMTEMWVDRA